MRKTPIVTLILVAALVAGCGGGRRGGGDVGAGYSGTRFATGPIYSACMAAGRKAASNGLCGCVQSAADASLSGADQRRAAGFFKDPQKAHDTKMARSGSADAFWDRYKNFVSTAEAFCQS